MPLQEQVNRQRIQYIVDSYQLDGDEAKSFSGYLESLIQSYPIPLIELALIETLVEGWLNIPLVRGLAFLAQAHQKLKNWDGQSILSGLTPEQFQQITGLNPASEVVFSNPSPISR